MDFCICFSRNFKNRRFVKSDDQRGEFSDIEFDGAFPPIFMICFCDKATAPLRLRSHSATDSKLAKITRQTSQELMVHWPEDVMRAVRLRMV